MLFIHGDVFRGAAFARVNVRTEGDVIAEIGAELAPRAGETIVDISGKKLIPGLIDVHTHGRAGQDFTYADETGILRAARDYAANGVTSILATTMTMEESFIRPMLTRLGRAIDMPGEGSRVLGINLEGPFLGRGKKGCHDELYLRPVDSDLFRTFDECAGGHIVMVDIDPCYPESPRFIREFAQTKIVSIAHTEAGYEAACAATDAGASHVTHLFNAMNPLHHREPGVIGMAFDKPVFVELIADGLHIHPSVIRLMFAAMPEKICLVSDSQSAAGCGDGVYELGGFPVYVKDGIAALADGTLASSVISVFEGMKRCMRFGVDESRAILAATLNPAKSIRMDDRIGSITEGRLADMLVVTPDYELEQVYVGGKRADGR